MKTYTSIGDILPKQKGWEAIVKVIEMTMETRARSGTGTYQHYIFEDEKGGRVRGVTLNQDVRSIGSKFKLNKKYKISNAEVSTVKEEYVRDGITTQWIIKFSTVVQELPDAATPSVTLYQYTAFPDLVNFVDAKTAFVDVIGVVVDCTRPTEIVTGYGQTVIHKFTLIDNQMHSVTLSLWGDHATLYGPILERSLTTLPVVICHRVRVSYFKGIEVSTNRGSIIIIEPQTIEADDLRTWVHTSYEIIQERKKEYDFNMEISEFPIHEDKKHIAIVDAIPAGTQSETAWVKGTINLRHSVQSYCYVACKKCQQTSSCEYNEVYSCNKCGLEQVATPRCKFNVEIKDASGCIYAAVYGKLGEKIVGSTAANIVQQDQKGQELDIDRIQLVLDSKLFSMQVKMYPPKNEHDIVRYTIMYLADLTASSDSFDISSRTMQPAFQTEKRKASSLISDVEGGLNTTQPGLNTTQPVKQCPSPETDESSELFEEPQSSLLAMTPTSTKEQRTGKEIKRLRK